MSNTTNYTLEKHEPENPANLLDQYNASTDKIDAAIKSVTDLNTLKKPQRAIQFHQLNKGIHS